MGSEFKSLSHHRDCLILSLVYEYIHIYVGLACFLILVVLLRLVGLVKIFVYLSYQSRISIRIRVDITMTSCHS